MRGQVRVGQARPSRSTGKPQRGGVWRGGMLRSPCSKCGLPSDVAALIGSEGACPWGWRGAGGGLRTGEILLQHLSTSTC